jgi:hypothetical protein
MRRGAPALAGAVDKVQLQHAVQAEDLPLLSFQEEEAGVPPETDPSGPSFQKTKRELVSLFEREYLEEAQRRSGGNIA